LKNKQSVKQPIVGYHRDDEQHWVAKLACGHNQHVRHNPPWTTREWVTHQAGRNNMIGHALDCVKCPQYAPRDWQLISDFHDN